MKGGDDPNDDLKEGKEEPQHIPPPPTTAWWKLLLCNLLAASVGAGVTFLLTRDISTPASTTVNKAQPESTSAASLASSLAASLEASLATSTALADLALPTASTELLKGSVSDPDGIAGKILDCGGNPEEARAKGCIYDVMMQDWLPEPCYDKALTEKYLAQGNWTWYADGEGKTVMSDEQMAKGEHGRAWMSVSYHKAHCIFSWMKIIRALRNNKGISQELLSYDHVMHCSMGALRQDSEDEGLGVSAPTNYARCALYDTWLNDLIPDEHDSTS